MEGKRNMIAKIAGWYTALLHPHVEPIFLKIAEPRIIRLMQFGIYLCMIYAGFKILLEPPPQFNYVLGRVLAYMFGTFIFFGAVFGAIAVLPGIWWLERVGLIALATGMLIYVIVVVALGSSPLGIATAIAFGLTFLQRWMEIKGPDLAPREE
jgi:hypothetical protein